MRKKESKGIIVFFMLLLVFCGCKKKEQQAPPAPQPKPAVQVAASPVQKQPSSAKVVQAGGSSQVDFSKMKDPFRPFVTEVPKTAAASKNGLRRLDALPIESYEVSRFRVAGIIVGLKENSALIIDPAGKGYVVKPGMAIGNSNGRIIKITATAIEVDEKYVEDSGRVRKRTVKLVLPQKK